MCFFKNRCLLNYQTNCVTVIFVGTAVWCLCSDETDSVQYHIDYAELYRYETNIIYPPLYAGTCQVSPISGSEDMEGGDFQANVTGVEHYRRFGYKGRHTVTISFFLYGIDN